MHNGLADNVQDHEVRIRVLEMDNTETKITVKSLCRSMDKIEANTTWILRLIIGAFALAVLGLVLI
jgi:hypothetical protein